MTVYGELLNLPFPSMYANPRSYLMSSYSRTTEPVHNVQVSVRSPSHMPSDPEMGADSQYLDTIQASTDLPRGLQRIAIGAPGTPGGYW